VARKSLKLLENEPGPFFVDTSCIDCDTCRQVAPETFARSAQGQQSYVRRQPSGDEVRRARMALAACPTAAIGCEEPDAVKTKRETAQAARAFPIPIDEDVFYCGFSAQASFGAASYFVRRPEGNLLVDSPRAACPLLERIADWGGIELMFLTHRDDVADHAKFQRRFACRRILHASDKDADTRGVEWTLEGDAPINIAPDLLAIPVPGHTRGSSVLLYRERYLFTGDHVWGSDEGNGLEASRALCWYSWSEQIASMERLLDYSFEWVLPGHGRRFHAQTPALMRKELAALVLRMRAEPAEGARASARGC
jgi:glyoxylase-like metal-dependent hydrolase (beta-lactamase superfamily II)/ferredoxin